MKGKKRIGNKIMVKNRREEVGWLIKEIEKTLLKRRGYASRLEGKSAVMLMSGGMDSTILADMVLAKTDLSLYPFFVRRGARAGKYEEKAFDYFCDFFSHRYPRRFLTPKKVTVEVPPREFKKYRNRAQLKHLGHPLRNVMLEGLGVQYAYRIGFDTATDIRTVIIATTPNDFFPHSSLLAARIATLMVCVDSGDWRWNIIAPLIDPRIWRTETSKEELVKWAVQRKIPIEKTRTCTQRTPVPCGKCVECRERTKVLASTRYDNRF